MVDSAPVFPEPLVPTRTSGLGRPRSSKGATSSRREIGPLFKINPSEKYIVRPYVVAEGAIGVLGNLLSASLTGVIRSRTPRRTSARIALHAGPIPHQREVAALRAHLAFVALGFGFCAAFGLAWGDGYRSAA